MYFSNLLVRSRILDARTTSIVSFRTFIGFPARTHDHRPKTGLLCPLTYFDAGSCVRHTPTSLQLACFSVPLRLFNIIFGLECTPSSLVPASFNVCFRVLWVTLLLYLHNQTLGHCLCFRPYFPFNPHSVHLRLFGLRA